MDDKFSFDPTFQEEGLKFILNNPDGSEAIDIISPSYFTLLEDSIIFHAIQTFYKSQGRVPSLPFLNNTLTELFSLKEYQEALTTSDETTILNKARSLCGKPARDGDLILESLFKFHSFVEMQHLVESTDFSDFNNYESYSRQVDTILTNSKPRSDKPGTFLIAGIKERQRRRQAKDLVVPTPYNQVNALTSSGGYEPGSIIVLMDKPKKMKTLFLVNTARKYMASKKPVLYIDLENGENAITSRLEQSIGRVTQKEIIKGTSDRDIQKVLRRYKRLGGEVLIKRLPAFSTTADIQRVIDQAYRINGIKFGAIMIDYLALMGSLSNKKDDFDRISDAYLDVSNLLLNNPTIAHCWTANHVQRQASKRESTKYSDGDIAKCIDIIRHSHAIYGLNRSIDEIENGIVRLEIVVQREGVPSGRAYFRVDAETQRLDELTKSEVTELKAAGVLYDPTIRENYEDQVRSEHQDNRRGDV